MTGYTIVDTTTGIDLVAPKDHYFVGRGVTVSVTGDYAFFGDAECYGNSFRIRGTIETFGQNSAFLIQGINTRIAISGAGTVTSESTALELAGSHSEVVNSGKVTAVDFGIKLDDAVGFVKNTGIITSGDTGISLVGRGGEVENYGLITADKGIQQVADAGQITSIFNSGTVTGQSFSVAGSIANDTVVNWGELNGDVFLYGGKDFFRSAGGSVEGDIFGGRGRDTFDFGNGTVSGTIFGSYGNDTYIVGNANLSLHELAHGGHDKVISSVSYTLGVNMEILRLSANGAIDGTGNESANKIFGNDAANILAGGEGTDKVRGFGGSDTLIGGAGNDNLYGGGDADTFVFAPGGGHDSIRDFQAGVDDLDLSKFHDIADFHDLLDHHLKVSGKNLVIHADGDRLTLIHTKEADLHAADFTF
jgi:Ca2+-binding RTX toxin-like protein